MTGVSQKMTTTSDVEAFEIANLIEQQRQSDDAYLEFLRVSSMSLGLYILPAGAVDTQQPHTEDEVYYVMRGQGQIRVAEEDCSVQSGSVVFVAAGAKHYFHSIAEDLQILVFYASAEHSKASMTL
jgi:mannose-6-phosphate isomerase-like protein (cupin superfamily)